MTPTADYQTVLRRSNDWRGIVYVEVNQRKYLEELADGTVREVWVDQPVVKEGA